MGRGRWDPRGSGKGIVGRRHKLPVYRDAVCTRQLSKRDAGMVFRAAPGRKAWFTRRRGARVSRKKGLELEFNRQDEATYPGFKGAGMGNQDRRKGH